MFHGTSRLHTLVRSLRFLHNLGPMALGGVNRVETYTWVCNLYIYFLTRLCMCIYTVKHIHV